MCRKAGGRVALIRDLDVGEFNACDNRRVDVMADCLALRQDAQFATDTTFVSPLRDGSARQRAAHFNGAVLEAARRRKEDTYPEPQFLRGLATVWGEAVPMILQDRAKVAWLRREFDVGAAW